MSLLRKLLVENTVKPSVITYTTTDRNIINPYNNVFINVNGKQVKVVSNTYNDGFGKIIFGGVIASIRNNTFSGCTNLTSIKIPSGVTSIGNSAFRECHGLTSIEIPSGVTSIEDQAFSYCSNLINITVLAAIPPTLGTSVFTKIKPRKIRGL